jgi:hypothetical protein
MMMEAPWGLELGVKVNKQTRSQGLGLEYKEQSQGSSKISKQGQEWDYNSQGRQQ